MKPLASLAIALFSSSLLVLGSARAEEPRGREGREARPEEHHAAPQRRPAPPKFQPHPPGEHPHGPMVRQHPVRILPPRVVVRGRGEHWRHWEHPEFARPVYYWDWAAVRSVTCVAEDSYGDQYPVAEATGPGFGLANMTTLEDEALDRCYAESGQDPSCFLLTCSPY